VASETEFWHRLSSIRLENENDSSELATRLADECEPLSSEARARVIIALEEAYTRGYDNHSPDPC